jgi:hypothetical protein
LQEELEDFLDLLRLELLMDGVKVLGFVLPEGNFNKWVGVTLFKGLFGLEFQNIFDLLGPHNDAALEDMGFIFLRDIVSRGQFLRWSWQLSLTLDLSHGDKSLSEVVVKLLNKVLGNQFCPLT